MTVSVSTTFVVAEGGAKIMISKVTITKIRSHSASHTQML